MDPTNIIDDVEAERQRIGISILDLCNNTGLSRATYYHWIEKRTLPRLSQLCAVLDELDMTLVIHRRK